MKPLGLLPIFISLYALIWIMIIVGIILIRKDTPSAQKMRTWFLNKRIQQFQYPPFKTLLKLWIAGRFFPASFTFLFLIIIPAVLFFFLVGLLLITPPLALYQGLVVGLLIGDFRRREMVWAVGIGLFELGYWALSGALGMLVTLGFLFTELSLLESLLQGVDVFLSGYWIPLVLCIVVNAFGEVAGPIYWKMRGPVSLEVLARGEPIKDNDSEPKVNPT